MDSRGGSGADLQAKTAVEEKERGRGRRHAPSVYTGDPSVQPRRRLHQWGAVRGGESGQVGWQQCVRGLVFHDKALRLFLGGSGEICHQESDRVRFFQKDNP